MRVFQLSLGTNCTASPDRSSTVQLLLNLPATQLANMAGDLEFFYLLGCDTECRGGECIVFKAFSFLPFGIFKIVPENYPFSPTTKAFYHPIGRLSTKLSPP